MAPNDAIGTSRDKAERFAPLTVLIQIKDWRIPDHYQTTTNELHNKTSLCPYKPLRRPARASTIVLLTEICFQ